MSLIISRKSRNESGTVRQGEGKPVEIYHRDSIYSVAFFADGNHVVSGGKEQKIRCWRVEDGREVGMPMDAGGIVWNIVVSRDGKWIVSGTESGLVRVWNAESHEKVTEFKARTTWMHAMDVSPNGTTIATGSDDKLYLWSLSTGQQVLDLTDVRDHRLQNLILVAVKFSPNGNLIATTNCARDFVRIYDAHSGCIYSDIPIRVILSGENPALARTSDSTQLFALSYDGNIYCLNVSDGTTHSQWPIPNSDTHPMCIALASDETFIAVSADSSVSFWDTTSHKQIGSVIKHPAHVRAMAISANHDIVVGGGNTITLQNLSGTLALPYSDHTSPKLVMGHMNVDTVDMEETIELLLTDIHDLRAQNESSRAFMDRKIAKLQNTVRELRSELTKHQRKAEQEKIT